MSFICSHEICLFRDRGNSVDYKHRCSLTRHERQEDRHPCFSGNTCSTCENFKKNGTSIKANGKVLPRVEDLFHCRHEGCPKKYVHDPSRISHELKVKHNCSTDCSRCEKMRLLRGGQQRNDGPKELSVEERTSLMETMKLIADGKVTPSKRKASELSEIKDELFVVGCKTETSEPFIMRYSDVEEEMKKSLNGIAQCPLTKEGAEKVKTTRNLLGMNDNGLKNVRWDSLIRGTRDPNCSDAEKKERIKEAKILLPRVFGRPYEECLDILNRHQNGLSLSKYRSNPIINAILRGD